MGRPRKASVGARLLKILRKEFSKVPDRRDPSWVKVPMLDTLLCGFGIFALKFQSLLQFEEEAKRRTSKSGKANHSSNLKSLFGVKQVPSDTQMRTILDDVNPEDIRPIFKSLFNRLQRGKALKAYEYNDWGYLLSIDATGFFSSYDIHCSSCLKKQRGSGENRKTLYHHQMLAASIVHPDLETVIPVCPEPILRQDGRVKNDCEQNACKRFLQKFREDHPKLKVIVTQDALASNGPHVKDLKDYGMSFILSVKPGSHPRLFDARKTQKTLKNLEHLEKSEIIGEKVKKTRRHRFIWANEVLLNASDVANEVNFLDYEETTEWVDPKGRAQRKQVRLSWVTDIKITHDNVFKIMRGGRSHWKIENETFNTLKNQGYEFEHNFGHGNKHLSTVFAYLMMLAFLFDQAQQACCKLFQAALSECVRRVVLWEHFKGLYRMAFLSSWDDFLSAIAFPDKWKMVPDTS